MGFRVKITVPLDIFITGLIVCGSRSTKNCMKLGACKTNNSDLNLGVVDQHAVALYDLARASSFSDRTTKCMGINTQLSGCHQPSPAETFGLGEVRRGGGRGGRGGRKRRRRRKGG
jgi:hypothetical protein